MTIITYEEAADLIGVSVNALRSAAARGVITRLPRTGQVQPIIREQVILFQGKPRLSKHVLNAQEKAEWERYARESEKQPAQEEQARFEIPETAARELAARVEGFTSQYQRREIDAKQYAGYVIAASGSVLNAVIPHYEVRTAHLHLTEPVAKSQ